MKASLNLKPCDLPEDLGTFSELVEFVERERIPAGQVITRIVLDGEEVDDEAEESFAAKPLGEIDIVEFYSARTVDLAQEGLSDATALLPSLAEDLPAVAAELRGGNLADGLGMFGKCVEIVSWFVSLVTAVDIIFRRADPSFRLSPSGARTADDLSPEAELAEFGGGGGAELRTFASVENLRQKLLDIEQAQEQNDTLLLADLIEYELLPIVRIWIDEVPVLLSKVAKEGGSA